MSSDYICITPENQIIITILENEMNRRCSRSRAPMQALPFKKAMSAIAKFPMIIRNEYHAEAIDQIGDDLQRVIRNGLIAINKYDAGRGSLYELRRAQEAVKQQELEQLNKRKKKKIIKIEKTYIPKPDTATRAMFIVLGLSRNQNENGLTKDMIISRSRYHTNVDFCARHDTYGVYDGFKGITYLIQKHYVIKKKKLYHITDKGYDVYLGHCQPQQSYNHNSTRSAVQENKSYDYNDNDDELKKAKKMSLQYVNNNNNKENRANDDFEEDMKRTLKISKPETVNSNNKKKMNKTQLFVLDKRRGNGWNDENDENELEEAKKLSLECLCKENESIDVEMELQKRFEEDMDKAMQISAEDVANANDYNNKNNNNNKNGVSVLGKRKGYDLEDDDEEIEILSCSPKKKRKISVEGDLDQVALQNVNKNGSDIIYNGKPYRLKLLIDSAEQNLKNRRSYYFDVLKHATEKGVCCEYRKLSNADYIMVIESIMSTDNDDDDDVYLIDFGVERKRWDDLRESVLIDGRGKQQKERLKLTAITRKYYFIEGNERMIRDYEERRKCKEFIQETEKNDGYMIIYTSSKQETINKICDHYHQILQSLHQQNKQLVLENLTLNEFQRSQRIQAIFANKEMLDTLKSMGFDAKQSENALIAVRNKSVQDAIDYMYQ